MMQRRCQEASEVQRVAIFLIYTLSNDQSFISLELLCLSSLCAEAVEEHQINFKRYIFKRFSDRHQILNSGEILEFEGGKSRPLKVLEFIYFVQELKLKFRAQL